MNTKHVGYLFEFQTLDTTENKIFGNLSGFGSSKSVFSSLANILIYKTRYCIYGKAIFGNWNNIIFDVFRKVVAKYFELFINSSQKWFLRIICQRFRNCKQFIVELYFVYLNLNKGQRN